MKRSVTFFIVFFYLLAGCFSQEKPCFSLLVDVGWNLGLYREMTFSTVTQKLFSPKIGLVFDIETENFGHEISAHYDFCRPDSKQTTSALVYKDFDPITGESFYSGQYSSLSYHRINLTYDCLYKNVLSSEKFNLALGGNFQANAYLQFENYPSITGLLSIGPSVKADYILSGKDRLSLQCKSAILGYGIRPPYAGCDAELMKYAEEDFFKIFTLGDFLSLHNYQTVNLNLSYEHQVNNLINLDYMVDFEYSRVNVPKDKPLFYLSSSFSTGIEFNF